MPDAWPVNFSFTYREGNRVVHFLASLAIVEQQNYVWIESVPVNAERLIVEDIVSL